MRDFSGGVLAFSVSDVWFVFLWEYKVCNTSSSLVHTHSHTPPPRVSTLLPSYSFQTGVCCQPVSLILWPLTFGSQCSTNVFSLPSPPLPTPNTSFTTFFFVFLLINNDDYTASHLAPGSVPHAVITSNKKQPTELWVCVCVCVYVLRSQPTMLFSFFFFPSLCWLIWTRDD